jgi:hypothetical protein
MRRIAVLLILPVTIVLAAPSAQAVAYCDGHVATIVGTSASETIYGTVESDVIFAGGGDDIVFGGPEGTTGTAIRATTGSVAASETTRSPGTLVGTACSAVPGTTRSSGVRSTTTCLAAPAPTTSRTTIMAASPTFFTARTTRAVQVPIVSSQAPGG